MSESTRYSPNLDEAHQDDIYYALTMFPYPSGSGLHCGHASIFTINDIVARFQRMQGKTVLNPFGFDAFGLPTENYAMKMGKPAYEVTELNKAHFINQLKALHISFDWVRMLDTSKPDYYKWTQWIFAELFKAGLVYRDELWVNRCPDCQTVLANDQVVEGACERCKSDIIQKKMPQWFIKITDYADRLIEDLDLIDWPQETKIAQKNWIGKSVGAEVDFQIEDITITCFTTRSDTLYGVTALVLAPENTMIDHLVPKKEMKEVASYRKTTLAKTAVQRQKGAKDKTGVDSGLKAIHPLTGVELPIRFADYVLADYGSGAVMMVPAHDERDFEFAQKFGIDIISVIAVDGDGLLMFQKEGKIQTSGEIESIDLGSFSVGDKPYYFLKNHCHSQNGIIHNSGEFDGLDNIVAKKKIIEQLESEGKGRTKITYKLRDWSVSRQRYRGSPIPVWYDADGKPQLVADEELPVMLPLDIKNYKPKGKSPLEDHPTFPVYEKDGVKYRRECDTLDTFMCSSFYFLRYPNVGNDDALISKALAKKLFPVNFYSGGKEHTVGHLLYSRFIHKFLFDQGYVASPEPFAKLVHQGMVLGEDGRKMGKRYGNGVDPLEVIEKYGSDALRTYMMFMGPVEQDKIWNDGALNGVKKFLDRVERLCTMDWREKESVEVESLVHQTILGITHDIQALKLNIAVSKLMILVNGMYEAKSATTKQLESLTLLLAPFATELAEKMWQLLGHSDDVHFASWPIADASKIVQSSIELPVQINGKVRGKIEIVPGLSEEEVMALATDVKNIQKRIQDKKIKKIIYIQDKIINIIVA